MDELQHPQRVPGHVPPEVVVPSLDVVSERLVLESAARLFVNSRAVVFDEISEWRE